jgi:predicted dehydrogenase
MATKIEIRLGIIGVGRFTRLWHLKYLQGIPQAKIVGLADPSLTNIEGSRLEYGLEEAQIFTNHREMISNLELDAVIVASPHVYHFEHVSDALNNGIHVLADKPLANSATEIKQLLDLAAQQNLLLQVCYQRHLQPEYLFVYDYVRSGKLGDLCFCTAKIAHSWLTRYQGEWRQTVDMSCGGALIDTGRHIIDALLWIIDSRPTALSAVIEDYGLPFEVNAAILVQFSTGVSGQISVIGDSPWNHWWEELSVWGREGAIIYESNRLTVLPKNGDAFHPTCLPATSSPEENFCRALLGESEPVLSGVYDLQVAELIEGARLANELGEVFLYSTA